MQGGDVLFHRDRRQCDVTALLCCGFRPHGSLPAFPAYMAGAGRGPLYHKAINAFGFGLMVIWYGIFGYDNYSYSTNFSYIVLVLYLLHIIKGKPKLGKTNDCLLQCLQSGW